MTIARRYAKALLLISTEDLKTETYREELNGFAGLVAREKDLDAAISNPLYNAAERKKVLIAVIEKLNLSVVMASFLQLLFDKGRIKFLDPISDFFDQLADEVKGITRASLVSVSALPSETVDKIRASLSTMTGKNVVLELKQDPTLIGGIVTRIGDLVLDGSIKTQLLNMKKSIKRGDRV
ncbi:MAG: ATP synthase F1 subunit delta [Desulfobacterales bacterium]